MSATLTLHTLLATAMSGSSGPQATMASPEGVTAARGVLYLLAAVSFWLMIMLIRQASRVVSTLLRVLLVLIALTAFGALAAVAIIAQVALAVGPL
ncbi:hypothetical protein [Nonomuraea roseoviolacea]|uniref:DUF2182 domain-containing protein n=1 Tax=Nonomuraea roseoviolacea subsp. carminata TaxID=160689 RepID=A0ABT1KHR6_9ACTN|nr:hypothetical protein [Nonomuraea roseoviolacea]MCP2352519.1 hypothetical protein [Nonomuraea roseoviolacea subsp. carminata]